MASTIMTCIKDATKEMEKKKLTRCIKCAKPYCSEHRGTMKKARGYDSYKCRSKCKEEMKCDIITDETPFIVENKDYKNMNYCSVCRASPVVNIV